jgi:hypothetical protein
MGPRSVDLARIVIALRRAYQGPVIGASLCVLALCACGGQRAISDMNDGGDSGSLTQDGSSDATASPDVGADVGGDAGDSGQGSDNGACKSGFYKGALGGVYSSQITVLGIVIPLVAYVQLTLVPLGTDLQMCTFAGELVKCSDLFSLQSGATTEGSIDALFPFNCTLTGTLGCKEKKLVGGWIDCTYCIGALADGGEACADMNTDVNGEGGTPGAGGHFAGPLTSDYLYATGDGGAGPPSFGILPGDPGAWNAAEALGGYSGTGPLPDGGTLSDYLSDAGYSGGDAARAFGGEGTWYATYQHP